MGLSAAVSQPRNPLLWLVTSLATKLASHYERNARCAASEQERSRRQEATFLKTLALTPVRPSDNIQASASPGPAMAKEGSCTGFFLALAIIFDVVGLVLFFVGIFAPLSFWDFFVLSGPLLIFLSTFFWIFWYLGNLTVSEEELNLNKADIL